MTFWGHVIISYLESETRKKKIIEKGPGSCLFSELANIHHTKDQSLPRSAALLLLN